MKGRVLQQYLQPKAIEAEANDVEEADGLDDLGAFGFLRGVRDRAIMLELRHKDGSMSAFAYAWLDRCDFDPSEGITLHFSGRTVKITGRNLGAEIRPNVRLFQAVLRHRVPWIQEANEPSAMEAPRSAVVIERIDVTGSGGRP
jgi:hypothetical protein